LSKSLKEDKHLKKGKTFLNKTERFGNDHIPSLIFERLYENASFQRHDKLSKSKLEEQKRIDNEMKEVTLKPFINSYSKKVFELNRFYHNPKINQIKEIISYIISVNLSEII